MAAPRWREGSERPTAPDARISEGRARRAGTGTTLTRKEAQRLRELATDTRPARPRTLVVPGVDTPPVETAASSLPARQEAPTVPARISAAAVDAVVVTVPLVVAGQLGLRALRTQSVVVDLLSTGIFVLWAVGALLYLVVGTGEGQTLGKRLTGLVVVDDRSGVPIGYERALLRSVVLLGCCLPCYAGLVTVLTDPDGRQRGWHDRAAHSCVVRGSLP